MNIDPPPTTVLYNQSHDILRKALCGLQLAPATVATKVGLPESTVMSATRQPALPKVLETLAPHLHLHPPALAALDHWHPTPLNHPAIHQIEVPFDDETVNAWLIRLPHSRPVLFDAGDRLNDVRLALDALQIGEVDAFITHGHHDHIAGLPALQPRLSSLYGAEHGTRVAPGDEISLGGACLKVIDLPGHYPGALGFILHGLEVPIAITGDALFAGSIGGCPPGEPYQQALLAIRQSILSLPGESILLTGHGPATTVAQEREHNPFFPPAS